MEGLESMMAMVESGTVGTTGRIAECIVTGAIYIVATESALVIGEGSAIVSEGSIVVLRIVLQMVFYIYKFSNLQKKYQRRYCLCLNDR